MAAVPPASTRRRRLRSFLAAAASLAPRFSSVEECGLVARMDLGSAESTPGGTPAAQFHVSPPARTHRDTPVGPALPAAGPAASTAGLPAPPARAVAPPAPPQPSAGTVGNVPMQFQRWALATVTAWTQCCQFTGSSGGVQVSRIPAPLWELFPARRRAADALAAQLREWRAACRPAFATWLRACVALCGGRGLAAENVSALAVRAAELDGFIAALAIVVPHVLCACESPQANWDQCCVDFFEAVWRQRAAARALTLAARDLFLPVQRRAERLTEPQAEPQAALRPSTPSPAPPPAATVRGAGGTPLSHPNSLLNPEDAVIRTDPPQRQGGESFLGSTLPGRSPRLLGDSRQPTEQSPAPPPASAPGPPSERQPLPPVAAAAPPQSVRQPISHSSSPPSSQPAVSQPVSRPASPFSAGSSAAAFAENARLDMSDYFVPPALSTRSRRVRGPEAADLPLGGSNSKALLGNKGEPPIAAAQQQQLQQPTCPGAPGDRLPPQSDASLRRASVPAVKGPNTATLASPSRLTVGKDYSELPGTAPLVDSTGVRVKVFSDEAFETVVHSSARHACGGRTQIARRRSRATAQPVLRRRAPLTRLAASRALQEARAARGKNARGDNAVSR